MSSGGLTATQATDKVVSIQQTNSIYVVVRTKTRRNVVLGVAAVASILLPFCDTIYLPALKMLQDDYQTTEDLATASVAIYMFMVGLASLFWGPFADHFGRALTYYISMAGFMATTIVCIFAPSIGVLVAFRALQGTCVAATFTLGNAVVADIFPPEIRGAASGVLLIPLLIGPILGPLVGGGLSQALGWRSTFVALAIVGGVILLLLIILFPETHPYYVMRRLQKQDPALAATIEEASSIPVPTFQAPWRPLRYLLEPSIAIHALVALVTFGTMFASLVELPLALAAAPYSLSESLIGVAYLPVGVGGFLASPIGGRLADKAAQRFGSRTAEGRLVINTSVDMALMPASLLLFGWTLHVKSNLAWPLVGHFFIGVACSQYLPAIFSYLSVAKQSEAAAAAAMVQALMFVMAGILIEISGIVIRAIGVGPYFTILAGLAFIAPAAAVVRVVLQVRAAGSQQLTGEAGKGGTAKAGDQV